VLVKKGHRKDSQGSQSRGVQQVGLGFGYFLACVALVSAILLIGLWGCRRESASEYSEPDDANATVVVHPREVDGGTWDVFLDGERLGRISWSQAYRVRSGQHVLSAARPNSTLKGHIEFTIKPGQTFQFGIRAVAEEHFDLFSLDYSLLDRAEIWIMER